MTLVDFENIWGLKKYHSSDRYSGGTGRSFFALYSLSTAGIHPSKKLGIIVSLIKEMPLYTLW